MSGEVKYNIRGIEDLLKGLYNTYYFVFMVEDRDVNSNDTGYAH